MIKLLLKVFLAEFILIYLSESLVNWCLNPYSWSLKDRVFLIVATLIMSIGDIVLAYYLAKKKK